MKKYLIFILLSFAISLLKAGDVEFYLDVCRFQDTDDKSYIEAYFTVDGTSVSYEKMDDGNFQASVNFQVRLYRLEGDSVLTFVDNYNLQSLPVADTSQESIRMGFIDMKRIPVQPGKHSLMVIARDIVDDMGSSVANVNDFEVPNPTEPSFAFSDLEFISSMEKSNRESVFFKNGYEIIPFGMNSVYIDQDKLGFYVELYHSQEIFPESYFAQATILRHGQPLLMYDLTVKKNASAIDVFTSSFDISKLASQSYQLQIRLFSPGGAERLLTKKFHVYNSRQAPDMTAYLAGAGEGPDMFNRYSEEQLDYYLATLIHYSSDSEIRFSKALREKEDKKNYLYSFWEQRTTNEQDVTELWKTHLAALEYANDQYKSAFREGWATDRGRVLLLYGFPNDIERYPYDTNRLPHEIWKYDRLDAQSQILFVFLDNDLATNEYPLIHSNKYGELQNFAWQDMLINGDTPAPTNKTRDNYEENRTINTSGFRP